MAGRLAVGRVEGHDPDLRPSGMLWTVGSDGSTRVLAAPVVAETEVRRSRFVCRLARVGTDDEADAVVAGERRAHPGARHHCVAVRLGEDHRRSSDDGEPGGTAGTPMLEVLTARGVVDVVAVVSRYFGGTLLGAGGLVRAYGGVVGEALDTARLLRLERWTAVRVTADHDEAGRVEHALRAGGFAVDDAAWAARVTWSLAVPPDRVDDVRSTVASISAGRAEVVEDGHVVREVR